MEAWEHLELGQHLPEEHLLGELGHLWSFQGLEVRAPLAHHLEQAECLWDWWDPPPEQQVFPAVQRGQWERGSLTKKSGSQDRLRLHKCRASSLPTASSSRSQP